MRQTYDILDWLGDCGGLMDALFRLGSFIISAFTSYNVKNFLLTTLFRSTQSNKSEESPTPAPTDQKKPASLDTNLNQSNKTSLS